LHHLKAPQKKPRNPWREALGVDQERVVALTESSSVHSVVVTAWRRPSAIFR